jgi:hypothetical protein
MTSATGFAGAEYAENVALAGGAMRYRYLNYLLVFNNQSIKLIHKV